MHHALYTLYLKCFPDFPVTEALFTALLVPDKAHIFYKWNAGRLVGFSMLHQNSIALLCVDEDYRNKGVGTELLELSEKHLSAADKITLGYGSHYLLQGIPEGDGSAVAFFRHRGYTAGWSSVNMHLNLKGFCAESTGIPPCPDGISFRFLRKEELPVLLSAVRDVQKDWVGFFENGKEPVFIAESHGKILGFELLSLEGGRFFSNSTGSIGCVGVIHAAREKGIGRQLVARGIEQLQAQGCACVELLYVYLVDWYKKIGFEITCYQWMGEKILRQGNEPKKETC